MIEARVARVARIARFAAAALVVFALVAPTPAHAVQNIWKKWYNSFQYREYKWEIPFAIITTIPAMVVVTPFWLGTAALEALESDDEDEDEYSDE